MTQERDQSAEAEQHRGGPGHAMMWGFPLGGSLRGQAIPRPSLRCQELGARKPGGQMCCLVAYVSDTRSSRYFSLKICLNRGAPNSPRLLEASFMAETFIRRPPLAKLLNAPTTSSREATIA